MKEFLDFDSDKFCKEELMEIDDDMKIELYVNC